MTQTSMYRKKLDTGVKFFDQALRDYTIELREALAVRRYVLMTVAERGEVKHACNLHESLALLDLALLWKAAPNQAELDACLPAIRFLVRHFNLTQRRDPRKIISSCVYGFQRSE